MQAREQIQHKYDGYKYSKNRDSSLQQELKNFKEVEEKVGIKVVTLQAEIKKYKCKVEDILMKMAPSSEVRVAILVCCFFTTFLKR